MSQQQPGQTLASHLIAQTLSSVQLLESLGLIQHADAEVIRSKLPNPYTTFPSLITAASTGTYDELFRCGFQLTADTDLPKAMNALSVNGTGTTPSPTVNEKAVVPALPVRSTPEPQVNRARALWDYQGGEADDLQFRSGDTIIIDEEVNDQWFRGRVEGAAKTGLFPANYVEKIKSEKSSAPTSAVSTYQPPGGVAYGQPLGGPAYQQYAPVPSYQAPAYQSQQPQTVIVQPQEEKKGKFGKMGGQLGNAAVTGAGFGFGSAIAGNIVNAIL